MSIRRIMDGGFVCAAAALLLLLAGNAQRCQAVPKMVEVQFVMMWGFQDGEEGVVGDVDKDVAKAVMQKLKLKRLEVFDESEFSGMSGISWYHKINDDDEADDPQDNPDPDAKDAKKPKGPEMLFTVKYWGTQADGARFGLNLDANGKSIFNRNVLLAFGAPHLEIQKLGNRYLIVLMTAKPW